MRTVVIRVSAADLGAELAEMRKWLTKNRYEPEKFTTRRYGNTVAIYVEFDRDAHAKEFRSRFDGQKRPRLGDELLLKEYRWAFDFGNGGFGATNPRETIAQACWYRLVAEEVRSEADGFNSTSAKATMRVVAQTWDRMAEDLEHRLSRR